MEAAELRNRHKRIRYGDFRADVRKRSVRFMQDSSRHTRNENGADFARVLAALALLAWLSSWDKQDHEPAGDIAAQVTTQSVVR